MAINHDISFDKNQDVGNNAEEESFNPAPPASEANAAGKASTAQEQSTLKSRLASEIHFPKNKRKRGERKAGSGGWNRRMPGEPDSQ